MVERKRFHHAKAGRADAKRFRAGSERGFRNWAPETVRTRMGHMEAKTGKATPILDPSLGDLFSMDAGH